MKISLTKNKFVLVDANDFDYLNQWKWHLSAHGYAARKPDKKTIFMHRLIAKTPTHLQTDHINRNRLDNRRFNLRNVTHQQNHFNMSPQKNNKTGQRGVSWDKDRGKWVANIILNGKQFFLGRYKNKEKAIKVRKQAERIYYGN